MPKVIVEANGEHPVEVATGTRLVLAIKQAGVDISHRCGGYAGCTTCRVEFVSGEPARRTEAEADKIAAAKIPDGVRLSCQIAVESDMRVKALQVVAAQPWSDPGPDPEPSITPDPIWKA